jgi:glyoxylase-like metal-dependent hydrolase (beta-lactamase superfamily II)
MHDSLIKLATLPDDTVVYPGHDQPTSIGQERSRALIEY